MIRFFQFIKIAFIITVHYLLLTSGNCQDYQKSENSNQSLQSLLGLGAGMDLNVSQISSSNSLIASVNEDEYYIDAGDVFIIKIDVKGPAFKLFNAVVSPEGYLVIPDVPGINVKYLKLKDAKNKINKILKNIFPEAEIEAYLYYIHPIRVTVVGAIPEPVTISLFSNSRLFDAINSAFAMSARDTTIVFNWKSISYRNIDLVHNKLKEKSTFDLLKFKLIGEKQENPYLMDDDVVFVQYKDSIKHHIEVSGSVARPIMFEYKKEDNLKLAVDMAGGILPVADSSRIELLRFKKDDQQIDRFTLKIPQDLNFVLMPDDRIFAREKYNYHNKYSVNIQGAVKYPGEYAINEGISKLSNIIEQAGGFSEKASLRNAKLLRNKNILQDKELNRLRRMTVEEMNDVEISYFRLRSREDARLVSCDFEKLFFQNDSNEDVILRDEDLIVIPEITKTIFVSGGVIAPGYVNLESNRNYLDYILLAGGFNDRAREGNVKIIKNKSGVWLDAEKNILLEEGDIIFIPESEEIDWYDVFKEGLTILTQVATVVLIVLNLQK